MSISKEIDSKGKKKPILLKGTGQFKCLEVKIGNLGVELWDFPNGDAQPYVRLIFEPAHGQDLELICEETADHVHVDLDVMQTGALSVAIEQWLLGFESETKDENAPSLKMQIATLSITLFPPENGQKARAELIGRMDGGAQGQAVLTRLEVSLLGTLLESLGEDKETNGQEFVR